MILWQRGMTGPSVRALQDILAGFQYYRGSIDGIFGPKTEEAVRAFQSDALISVDGIVGPETRTALRTQLGVDTSRLLQPDMPAPITRQPPPDNSGIPTAEEKSGTQLLGTLLFTGLSATLLWHVSR